VITISLARIYVTSSVKMCLLSTYQQIANVAMVMEGSECGIAVNFFVTISDDVYLVHNNKFRWQFFRDL